MDDNTQQNPSVPEETVFVPDESTQTSKPSSPKGNNFLTKRRNVITTVFGLVVLVLAVGAGVIALRSPQILKNKAEGTGQIDCGTITISGDTCNNAAGVCGTGTEQNIICHINESNGACEYQAISVGDTGSCKAAYVGSTLTCSLNLKHGPCP